MPKMLRCGWSYGIGAVGAQEAPPSLLVHRSGPTTAYTRSGWLGSTAIADAVPHVGDTSDHGRDCARVAVVRQAIRASVAVATMPARRRTTSASLRPSAAAAPRPWPTATGLRSAT